MTRDSNQEREDQIILETDDDGNVVRESTESSEASTFDAKKGVKGLEMAAVALEKGKNSDSVMETVAKGVYASRNEKLQALWNWLSEDTQRNLLRADDRNALMKGIEKWFPQLDYRYLTDPTGKDTLRNILSALAVLGAIDVDEKILKDMRAVPGSGLLEVPDVVITAVCLGLAAYGMPKEMGAVLIAFKKLAKSSEGVGENIRARVEVLKREDELKKERQGKHHDMDDVLPDNVVPMHKKYPPDEEGRMAA